jgi:hypothetical protein
MNTQVNADELLRGVGEKEVSVVPVSTEKLHVATLHPVIYTGSAGGGPGEYAASPTPDVVNQHEIKVVGAGNVIAAFYQPYHNLNALAGFSMIDVTKSPKDKQGILLSVGGYSGSQARLRIKVTVLFEK